MKISHKIVGAWRRPDNRVIQLEILPEGKEDTEENYHSLSLGSVAKRYPSLASGDVEFLVGKTFIWYGSKERPSFEIVGIEEAKK